MKTLSVWLCSTVFFLVFSHGNVDAQDKHLFILSGQSNMGGLKPEESFIPTVENEFGKENVIVVKDAMGGQPIRRWYKEWQEIKGDEPKTIGDLYDRLMEKVDAAIDNQELKTVTFIWMQGERDARESYGDVYKESLLGLYKQLSEDMKRTDINFVIGRLSDFDMTNAKYPHWTKIREIQVEVAESNPKFSWINTDDLNDGLNRKGKEIKDDLHMSAQGYVFMGERFADVAIELIKKGENPEREYDYMFFENSILPGNYYFSSVDYTLGSYIKNSQGRLPVCEEQFFTPPNSLELNYTNGNGSWQAEIDFETVRGNNFFKKSDNLSFWIYTGETTDELLPQSGAGNFSKRATFGKGCERRAIRSTDNRQVFYRSGKTRLEICKNSPN